MGSSSSIEASKDLSPNVRQQLEMNRKIDEELANDFHAAKRTIKLLLLGAGECGKSTVLKQMRILHDRGYSKEELLQQKLVIRSNLLQCIAALVAAMTKLDLKYSNTDREVDAELLQKLISNEDKLPEMDITFELVLAMKKLWADAGVQQCFARANEFQLNDSASYFLDEIDRICEPSYIPNIQDVLRARAKTNGIVEVVFELRDSTFRVFDVGGQRSERRKWIHCFDNVNSIIFIVALSEYDQMMREDQRTNRMLDAMELFDSICNSKWFKKTSLILFLNKKDIFQQKITSRSITIAFPEYSGPQSYTPASEYIDAKYQSRNRNRQRKIYSHFTCATDTDQLQFVLDSVIDIVIANSLKSSGLY